MQIRFKNLLAVMLLGIAPITMAQDDDYAEREAEEARMAQAFRSGMELIVQDLNRDSFSLFVSAIDVDDMVDRIFGLRLIDQRIQRDFREDMEDFDNFRSFVESTHQAEAERGIKATLLLVESRGDRGRAVVRFEMSHFRVNYMEYDLGLDEYGNIRVNDWTDYLWGHTFSERMGLTMVQAHPNDSAVRKLIDVQVGSPDVFQVTEILKAARDYDFERFFQIYEGMDPRLQRQRIVILIGLDTARVAMRRRHQRTMLEAMAEHFPEEPLYSLSLLDYYFPTEQYELAYEALLRLKNDLRIDDGVTQARLSSATLVMEQVEDANAHAERAVELEPDLEVGWWALLRSRVVLQDHAGAVEVVDTLLSEFGHTLDPETLRGDSLFRYFVRSEEYRAWAAENVATDAG